MKGLDQTNEKDKRDYVYLNKRYFDQFDNDLNLKAQVIDVAWNNHRFKKIFGKETFNQLYDGGSQLAYDYRKKMLDERDELERNKALYQDWLNYASPYDENGIRDNNRGLGERWEQYSDMSIEGIEKVLQSDFLNKQEFENKWNNTARDETALSDEYHSRTGFYTPDAADDFTSVSRLFLPAKKEGLSEDNWKILDKIYNNDIDKRTYGLSGAIKEAYDSDNRSEEEVKKAFIGTFVSDKSDMVKSHKGTYAAYWGDSEMKDFGVDDMRKTLAKYKAYTENMPFNAAITAIDNEAKRYVRNHQGSLTRAGLFVKDFLISMGSYGSDIFNGIYTIGLLGADLASGPEDVYLDTEGNIVNPNRLIRYNNGNLVRYRGNQYAYKDDNGNIHAVDKTRMSRTILHNLGKNADGSDEFFLVSPQYWSDAEQYGTMDEDLQKKYKNYGTSPYKVAYNPNEDSDLWYEAFKMGSFGATDALMMLIPTGVGWLGKSLQTVSKTSRILNYTGKFLEGASRVFSTQSKTGQTLQATAGALGIAHAYERGAFQETLAGNLTKIDEAVFADSNNAVHERYKNDSEYKGYVDGLISKRAVEIKRQRLSELQEGQSYLEDALDKQANEQATNEVLSNEIDAEINKRKAEKRYQMLYAEAFNSAGATAAATFVPEALKYALVNNWGYRKFIFKNPSGFTRRISESLEGVYEKTLANGSNRLVTRSSKFGSLLDKAGQLGRIGLKNAWGGAWTNGTDDMMVDAAEQVNEDSFTNYMNGVYDGDAQAGIYGLGEALISYFTGFSKSLGQETTAQAALVGGLGSTISFAPNAVNIASIFTKAGRKNFVETVGTKYKWNDVEVTPSDNKGGDFVRYGELKTDAEGNLDTRRYRWFENLPRKIDFFIQNGILNTYYGKRQAETDLALRVHEANRLLEQYENFKDLKELVTTNMMMDDAVDEGDRKTGRFLNALAIVRTLEAIKNNPDNPIALSSAYNEAAVLMEGLSKMEFDPETDAIPDNEEVKKVMSIYYSMNPDVSQYSEHEERKGLSIMINNAKDLVKASEAYAQAEGEITAAERENGVPFSAVVRRELLTNRALLSHWQGRLDKMRGEIGDTSQFDEPSDNALLASMGNTSAVRVFMELYKTAEQTEMEAQKKQDAKVAEAKKKLDEARKELLSGKGTDREYELGRKVADAFQEYNDELMQKNFIDGRLDNMRDRISRIEKAQKDDEEFSVLTANEIFALDPVTRAVMLDDHNFSLYSKEQRKQIEKLKKDLVNRDPGALKKIQDISKLTIKVERQKDSYNRIVRNADAATRRLETMQDDAAKKVPEILDKKFAESIAGVINEFDDAMKPHDDITDEQKGNWVYRQLRRLNPRILNILGEGRLISPAYRTQLEKAKRWAAATEDLDAVISMSDKSEEWKKNVRDLIDSIIEKVDDVDQLMSIIGQTAEDSSTAQNKEDLQYIERGLLNLGYQKGVVKTKSKKERKAMEARRKKEREQAAEAAKKAAENAAKEAKKTGEKKKEEEEKKPKEQKISEIKEVEESTVPSGDDKMVGEPQNVDLEDSETPKKAAAGDNTGEGGIVEKDGDMAGQSKDLDQQKKDIGGKGEVADVSSVIEDLITVNNDGVKAIETDETSLSGNAMSEWDSDSLRNNGILKHKKGKTENDSMNKFYAWMRSAGIHLQNIIDDELAHILRENPHTKVKFMVVRPDTNATHDDYMKSHLMLVIDYDDKINKDVTKIHHSENGGVIESNGRKYLIIGVAGYGNNTGKRSLYDLLYGKDSSGIVGRGSRGFFEIHPNERFFVDESFDTEIIPESLIPGYVVNQLENDEDVGPKKISEILADKRRNPHGHTLDGLGWIIQLKGRILIISEKGGKHAVSPGDLMSPRNSAANRGRVFALVEASNGRWLPIKINALKYNEMNEGALKDEIMTHVNDLASTDYDVRINAIKKLSYIFLFDVKEGDSILTRKASSVVTFMSDGMPVASFDVSDPLFDRSMLIEALEKMNPRVNVTANALSDSKKIKELDEAGALMTDVAKLGTSGSSYSIYGVDTYGNMLGQNGQPTISSERVRNSDYRNSNKTNVIFRQKHYTKIGDTYYLDGKEVTKEDDIKQLEYNRLVNEGKYKSLKTTARYYYYVMDATDKPKVIKVDKNSKDVVELTDQESKELVDKFNRKKAENEREKSAKNTLKQKPRDRADKPADTKDDNLNRQNADYITVTKTSEGLSVITKSPHDWYFKSAGDMRQKNDGFELYQGLWYYKKSISGRDGDNITIWFKDKPSQYVRDHIEEVFKNTNGTSELEAGIVRLIKESSYKEQKEKKQETSGFVQGSGEEGTYSDNPILEKYTQKLPDNEKYLIGKVPKGDARDRFITMKIEQSGDDSLIISFHHELSLEEARNALNSENLAERIAARIMIGDDKGYAIKAFTSDIANSLYRDSYSGTISIKVGNRSTADSIAQELRDAGYSDILIAEESPYFQVLAHKPNERERGKAEAPAKPDGNMDSKEDNTQNGILSYKAASPTESFKKIYQNPLKQDKIYSIVQKKWKDAPTKYEDLAEFLKSKNVEVNAIGTSQEDFEAWLKTIEDCR